MPFSFLPDSSRYRHRSFGFTFIEVLLILILLGILSAVAVSRINSDTDQWTNPDIFASHLRYAQSRAMAMEQPWGLQTQNGVYTMFKVEGGIVRRRAHV